MPLYECISPPGTVTDTTRPQIAAEITRLHTEATGAPKSFVHVAFLDLPRGAHYTAAQLDPHTTIIAANIRSGRSLETRQNLIKAISASWSRLTGQPENQLVMNVTEVESETVMEFGLILPAPGHEDEWMKENAAALAGIQGAQA